jgi:2-polyprenyl-3-methyl-5-hydroxy-6-metoxy-1,4-benzoquinol methylase
MFQLRRTEVGRRREFSVAVATEAVAACDLCEGTVFAFERTSPDLVERLVAGEHAYVRCLRCRLCFLSPRPAPGEIDRVYPQDYEPHADLPPRRAAWWQRLAGGRDARPSWWQRMLIAVRQRQTHYPIPPWTGAGKILDVGCGGGAFLDTMAQLGWETHGRDPSAVACAAARRKGHQVRQGTAADIDDPPESYDVVYINQVLEHTVSPIAALRRLRDILRPEGRLVLAVPNYGGLQMRLFGRYSSALDPPRHLYQFERHTLRRYLYAAGFRDVAITTRTGAQSVIKALRLLVNDLCGTGYRREPAWLSFPFELLMVVCGLFRFFGAGRDLRAVARRSPRP